MTTHSVVAVGRPLLAKGVKQLRPGERIEARLGVPGTDDVLAETDAAARVLLLWGRRPADPSRICSRVGPEILGRLRQLLSGY
jgi:hypothetical protein